MKLSFLQLNIFAGMYWENLSAFLEKNDFDVINFQEVAGKHTRVGVVDTRHDCYEELQTLLQDRYQSTFVLTDRFTSSPDAYTGNATFYKKQCNLIHKDIVWLHKNDTPFPSDATSYEDNGKAVLHTRLSLHDQHFSILNTHGAWAKDATEHTHQMEQGERIIEYLKSIDQPYILSGDFNLNPQQPTIQKLNTLARNVTTEHHITNTLNPRTHYAKKLFPSGIAVDYIFVSSDIQVKSFTVVEEDISDHFGLTAEFDI